MAPVFLYIASNRYLYNTRIFKHVGHINIHLLSKSLTTAKYVFSHINLYVICVVVSFV